MVLLVLRGIQDKHKDKDTYNDIYNIYYNKYYIMTKIFTMVKGEVDIVNEWVLYHGSLFGFTNLYIIDNLSRDGTWEALVNLKAKYNINISRLPDYKKKGEYMTTLFKSFCRPNEIGIPIDIDEFVVYYDKNTNKISCNGNQIFSILNSLPPSPVYKMNYIFSKITVPNGYDNAVINTTNGVYLDYGTMAKSFFNKSFFNGEIDHGNHYNTSNYIMTNLCLVHYHCRNLDQMKKKIYNNVSGLGYSPFNLNELKTLLARGGIDGGHHVENQISVLENRYKLSVTDLLASDIDLTPISQHLLRLPFSFTN